MTSAALGFGVSGPHGASWFSERELARLVAQAIDGGIRHFDTAPFYGDAEARLGRALKALRVKAAVVSTKTGTRRKGRRVIKDFTHASICADADASLERLNTERLDALYLHGPSPQEAEYAQDALEALKREGKIAAYGVCGEGLALERAVALGFGAIMGAYNVIDRRHEAVFAAARAAGAVTVGIAPLAKGAIAAPIFLPRRPADLWTLARALARGAAGRAEAAQAREAMADLALARGQSRASAALAFVLRSGVTDLTLTTTTSPAHLAEALEASHQHAPPSALDPQGARS
ncbi:MAG: aldo/keto reductase [Parvularculaceae bacterium]